MKAVGILGGKGGVGKSATSHLLCLGAHLQNAPACYVLTDPTRKLRGEGRPYAVLDGRLPQQLALIFANRESTANGWMFIDGGGNRPEFDKQIAENVDLCLIPFRNSEEDIDTVAQSLSALPNSFAWPCAWPTNAFAIHAAEYLNKALSKAFPGRVILHPIPFVNSICDLLAETLHNPSSAVRTIAKKAFNTMEECYGTNAANRANHIQEELAEGQGRGNTGDPPSAESPRPTHE